MPIGLLELLLIPFIVIAFIFFVYGLILLFFMFKREEIPELKDKPMISVIFPTFNESYIIEDKIKNILDTEYPSEKIEIIISDDSTDDTPQKIKKLQKKYDNLLLNRTGKRRGYSQSMIDGVKQAKGEIIIISDAGSYYDQQTIPRLVRHFSNPKIGAVTGKNIIINKNKILGFAEHIYRIIYDKMRYAEAMIDSTFHLNGEATAVRRNIVKNIKQCPANFDYALGFETRKLNYRSNVDLKAYFYEKTAYKVTDRVHVKKTRAEGVIKVLFHYRKMLFNPKYKFFGVLIYPANFFMFIIAPIGLVVSFLLVVVYSMIRFTYPLNILIIAIFCLIGVLLLPITISFTQFEIALIKGLIGAFKNKNQVDYINTVKTTRFKINKKENDN